MTSLSPAGDHLWQSTLFTAMVWVLTVALKRARHVALLPIAPQHVRP